MTESEVPSQAPARATRRLPSVIVINTGEGKGKSTAAFGTALRAVARGWKVCVVQFIKSERWKVGERDAARRLGIEWSTVGDGFTWDSADLARSAEISREAWRIARDGISSGAYGLVVLDEVTYPINWGWIPLEEVVATLRSRPQSVNVVLTGRDAPLQLIEVADTVTEMRKVKHAFDAGVKAIRGIDF